MKDEKNTLKDKEEIRKIVGCGLSKQFTHYLLHKEGLGKGQISVLTKATESNVGRDLIQMSRSADMRIMAMKGLLDGPKAEVKTEVKTVSGLKMEPSENIPEAKVPVSAKAQPRLRDITEFKPEDQKDILAVEAVKSGDKEAYAQIWNRYRQRFMQKITPMVKRRETAEDCVSDILAKAFVNIGKYKPTHTFNAWISFLAKNYMIDFSRKSEWKSQLSNVSLDDVFNTEDGDGAPFADSVADQEAVTDARIQMADEKAAIIEAYGTLEEKERTIIEMACGKQMRYEEVAKAEGIPIGTVKAVLFRSKKKVAMYIARMHPEIADYYIDIAKRSPKELVMVTTEKMIVDGQTMLQYFVK